MNVTTKFEALVELFYPSMIKERISRPKIEL